MTTSHRDLALVDPWRRSLERSLHRRAITPAIRRSLARRRRASVALSTLMVAGPTGSLLAAAGFGLGGARVDVAQASPANRAIDSGATPAAMAFKLGSRGDAVAEIQRQLGVSADGFFGPVTQVAVQHFQARNGLDVDGVVGPATWTALFGLEQAAAAAGARDGSVAVILREREDASAATAGGDGSGAESGTDSGTTGDGDSIDANGIGGQDGSGSPSVGGDSPASDGAPGNDPASSDGLAPQTKPVSTPAPTNGACGPLRLSDPVDGTVTSGFGPRWGRNHDGLDIAAPSGTPIRAAECGIVSFAGVQSGYGNMVCVKHSSRFETCYAHMTKYAVAQGQRVEQGEVIGYVGCTGNCTGPHLHFETRVDGSARDPRPYLGGGSVPGAPTVKAAVDSKTKAVAAATIAKDVKRARFAKTIAAAQPQAATAWSSVETQQPVASTGAPATTPAPAPAPVTTAPAPAPVTTAPAAAPDATAPPVTPPAPEPTTPQPSYEAPQPTYTPPTTPGPAATPVPETAVAPVPATPAPAPTGAPAPAPTTPAPATPAPTPTPDTTTPAPGTTTPPPPVAEAPAPSTTPPHPSAIAPPVEAPPTTTPPVEQPAPEPAPAPGSP